jgi:hypothetical protein
MQRQNALEMVTEVTAAATETKQVQQYEPSKAYVEYKAQVPEDENPALVELQLEKQAQEDAKRMITRRIEEQIRQEEE